MRGTDHAVDQQAPAARRDADDADAVLLARVASGDRQLALAELYQRYAGRVYGLGRRLLGDEDAAEELVQETFLRLWQKAGRFDPERGTVAAFLFTIARRTAIDLWRRRSARPPQADAVPLGEHVVPDHLGADAVEQIIRVLTVRDALDSLSPAHREVLELSYRRDLRQKDIAELLDLPLGTVKTRSYYAIRALKLALEERGFDV